MIGKPRKGQLVGGGNSKNNTEAKKLRDASWDNIFGKKEESPQEECTPKIKKEDKEST